MKEFRFVEKVTDNLLLTFIIWIVLASLANLFSYMGFGRTILEEALLATLQGVGLFLFIKAVWRWYKRLRLGEKSEKILDVSSESPISVHTGQNIKFITKVKSSNSKYFFIKNINLKSVWFIMLIGVIILLVTGWGLIKYQDSKKTTVDYKYNTCIEACDGYRDSDTGVFIPLRSEQKEICVRECIFKYK